MWSAQPEVPQLDGPSRQFEKQHQPSVWEQYNPLGIPKAEAAAPRVTPDQVRLLLDQKNDKGQSAFTVDQVVNHLAEVDPDLASKIQLLQQKGITNQQIANKLAYGSAAAPVQPKQPKEFGAGMLYPSAQQAQPKQGLLSTIWDYATAPIDAAVGGIEKGINAVTSTNIPGMPGKPIFTDKSSEIRDLKDNIRQTSDIAPTIGGVIGSAAGPVGTAAGTFAGQAVNQLIDSAQGENTMTPVQQITTPVIEGAIAGAVDYGVGKLAKGAKAAADYIGDTLPGRVINSLIKPGAKEFKFGKNPGRAIAEEGIVASSVDDLFQKVSSHADDIGTQIEQQITNAGLKNPPQIDVTKIITDKFDDAIKEAGKMKRTGEPLVNSLTALRDDLVDAYGGTHVPLGGWEAKKGVSDLIKWNATDPFIGEKNKALWGVFDGLRGALNDSIPGLAKLNERYSELAAAKAAIGRRLVNAERSNMVGLTPLISGGISGGATFAQTGDLKQSAVAAGIGGLGAKVAGAAGAKTLEAQALRLLSKPAQGLLSTLIKLAPAERAAILQLLQTAMPDQNDSSPQ